MMSTEKEDCLERLRKIQRELQLISDFQDKEEEDIAQLRKERDKQREQVKFLDEALTKIQTEQKQQLNTIEVSKY
jgi:hypothetical protein